MKKIVSMGIAAALIMAVPVQALAANDDVTREEVLMKGDQDEWVVELQDALRKEGFFDMQSTGYFGTDTEAAVLKFQEYHEMSQDGKAGPVTRKILLGPAYQEITDRDVKDDIVGTDGQRCV